DRLGAVAKRCAVSEDLSAAGHITSSGVTRPGAAKFTALKRLPEADRTDGGRLILSIDEVCFTDCHLSDRPFSPPPVDLRRLDRYTKYSYSDSFMKGSHSVQGALPLLVVKFICRAGPLHRYETTPRLQERSE